jgi:hypothetical protein
LQEIKVGQFLRLAGHIGPSRPARQLGLAADVVSKRRRCAN